MEIKTSNFYRIKFSDDSTTLLGEPLEEAREKHIHLYKDELIRTKVDPDKVSPATYEEQRKMVVSKRESEKNILIQLFKNGINEEKSIEVMNEIIDVIEYIKKDEGYRTFSGTNINRIKASFKKLPEVNPRLFDFADLFRQLNSPEDVTEKNKDKEENKEENKEEKT